MPERAAVELIENKYEYLGPLGEGGMAKVFLARHVHLDEKVALKSIAADIQSNPEALARFQAEARLIRKFDHPHIVRGFDLIQWVGVWYQVCEYIDGGNLKEYLQGARRLPLEGAVEVGRQVADALRYSHQRGVFHRDLKPGNIMLRSTEPWDVVLIDFGVAKVETATDLTRTRAQVGTPRYQAPEQFGVFIKSEGKRVRVPVSARTDIFSFALLMYEMLEGRAFNAGLEADEIQDRIVFDTEQPLTVEFTTFDPPDPLRKLLDRCLERDPKERPGVMDEVIAVIDRCVRGSGAGETRVITGR